VTELTALLAAAAAASLTDRIEWRDRIAAHGVRGIEAVGPWLDDPKLAAFAVRVIERAGETGEAASASRILRSARTRATPAIARDIDWALRRLKLRSRPTPSNEDPMTLPLHREPVRKQPIAAPPNARRRTR
jgi:hypothetical protein